MVGVVSINTCHVIDVVVLHRINDLLDQRLVKLEARKVLRRVLIGNGLNIRVPIDEVFSILDELANFRVMVRG